MKKYIITLIFFLPALTFSQRYIDTSKTDNYYFTISQKDRDNLWYELFHPKDFVIPKDVKTVYIRNAELLIFLSTNTAYDFKDLSEYTQNLILHRVRSIKKYKKG